MRKKISDSGIRKVYAPNPNNYIASGSVISVLLSKDEDKNWIWTHKPNGESYVTGYEIIKKLNNLSAQFKTF